MARRRSSSGAHTGDESSLIIGGREVTLTRLNKVLYPEAKFTKAQVIDYYLRVAPFILPHLKNRPVTLKRYPDGVKGEAYWDKDAPSFTPEWVERFPVPRHGGGPDINYILITETATLAWSANIAALELHPFLHRKPNIDVPTSIVFDLDPGEGADILNCIEVALLLRDVFERLRLQSFPKVSGSKGIQLYLPLNTPTPYSLTQPFARTVAELIETERPDVAVSAMAKELRTGKVFIDWSQNADYKTTVGVYSLRAKSERPFVSMPARWDELEAARKRNNAAHLYFEPQPALRRLEKLGDLFAPVLELKQTIPPEMRRAIERHATRSVSKSLHGYESKRDFSKTSEPIPRRSTQGGRRRFVVQKHAASHLHYDLRLEIGGVLKSWAVPKDIPLEPGIRRLASATEDHPLDYLDFEGTIPHGQYGGGTVMVWDIGTMEIIEGNYWKGTLHVGLDGVKLKGEWMLTKDRAKGGNAWVLEKTGGASKPISAHQNETSALTGRTITQIAESNDAQWHSNRAAKDQKPRSKPKATTRPAIKLEPLPERRAEFIEPMQCKLESKLPQGSGWQYEAKLDGYRALVVKTSEDVCLFSRRNNPLGAEFPEIVAALPDLDAKTVIDGEIVALDENGKPAFNRLQNRRLNREAIRFYAFDVLVFRAKDLMGEPLRRRREILTTALAAAQPPVYVSAALEGNHAKLIAAAREYNLEGIIDKRLDSLYEPGKRSGAWVKVKVNLNHELVIGGYIPALKRCFDALLVGYYERDRLIFAGKIRNGFKEPGSKERIFPPV